MTNSEFNAAFDSSKKSFEELVALRDAVRAPIFVGQIKNHILEKHQEYGLTRFDGYAPDFSFDKSANSSSILEIPKKSRKFPQFAGKKVLFYILQKEVRKGYTYFTFLVKEV